MARPGKWDKWISEVGLVRIQGWARDGLTDAQIAENMGISAWTLIQWKKRFPQLANALKEDKDYCDRQVENALYKAACEGNTTAMIFWLKNRKILKWRERHLDDIVDKDISIKITGRGSEDYGD